ncbi:MAG: Sjogren's syndrome/scleroderma autoantigen 1 family protein [Halodesulfurarchaeum sp.]
MSEDFDKEAERERLREKYENEDEERATTERMSELLLQGATMTNKHCDACGSPIFRYEGQEFCPTCQAEAQTAEADTQVQEGDSRTAEAQVQETDSRAAEDGTQPAETASPEPPADDSAPVGASTGGAEAESGSREASEPAVAAPAQSPSAEQREASTAGSGTGRDALEETIRVLATRARRTEDPRQATSLLEAAREAAEALSTLETGR